MADSLFFLSFFFFFFCPCGTACYTNFFKKSSKEFFFQCHVTDSLWSNLLELKREFIFFFFLFKSRIQKVFLFQGEFKTLFVCLFVCFLIVILNSQIYLMTRPSNNQQDLVIINKKKVNLSNCGLCCPG